MNRMNHFRYLGGLAQAISNISLRLADSPQDSVHRALIAVDITGFGDPDRNDEVQVFVRQCLYDLLKDAFIAARVPWRRCRREDRGDGVFIVVPSDVSTTLLLDSLVYHLRTGLRRHNRLASGAAQIRLRMAVHAGYIHVDPHGVSGQAIIRLFRMLEAPEFKRVFAAAGTELGLITSDYLYDELIGQCPGLIEPSAYLPVEVSLKETHTLAWASFPPMPVTMFEAKSPIHLAPPSAAIQ